jgi:hypothetical protein
MKHFKFFPLLLIGLFYISNGCFSKNEDNFQIAFDFIPGEVFIRLSDGYNQSDLENIIDDFNVEIDRNLGDGYVISVPVDFEPLWITQFSSIPIVEESTYNRFGYNYLLSEETHSPIVNNDSLSLTVSYSGCNNDHIFSLERPGIFTDNMIIWLLKRTPDEDCTQSFSEQLTFNLERFILFSENVYIEDPFGTQILLWPIPEEPTTD